MTNTPSHEILGVTELTTIDEAKKAYFKLFYKNQQNNEMMVKLNDAFNLFKSSLNEDKYLEVYEHAYNKDDDNIEKNKGIHQNYIIQLIIKIWNLLRGKQSTKTEFKTVIDSKFNQDFFEKLSNRFQITQPIKFTDPDFTKFYSFWNKFRMEDKECERKIRKIIKIIKDNDPRLDVLKVNNIKPKANKVELNTTSNKIKKECKFSCKDCNKTFNSENTLKDHLKSKQHRIRHPEEPKVENRTKDENKTVVNKAKDEEPPFIKTEECNKEEMNKSKGDHPIFRTCGICKEVLETRSDLLKHLRTVHQ